MGEGLLFDSREPENAPCKHGEMIVACRKLRLHLTATEGIYPATPPLQPTVANTRRAEGPSSGVVLDVVIYRV